MHSAILTVLLFVAVNAAPQKSDGHGHRVNAAAQKWDGLRVTWSLNPFSQWAFNSLPREVSAAKDFIMRDNQCAQGGAKFLGQRYWYKTADPALTLLYDKNGIIAGIQTSALKSKYTPSADLKNLNFVDDGDYWTITAYFVDPSTICTTGRTKQQLETEGTGTGLWMQVGPDPIRNSNLIPMSETDVQSTLWTEGHCFPTMGNHYWYDVKQAMSCAKFVPNCLLYNKGQLTAFCFALNANLESDRYEHPTNYDAANFINPVPDCFYSDPSFSLLSTIHVYLMDNAKFSSNC